jgi:hypothetical protein
MEIRSMSIQSLKQSLPELSEAAFEKVYRQFFLRSVATVLAYEVSRAKGARTERLERDPRLFPGRA